MSNGVKSEGRYVFTNVTAAHTIEAKFERESTEPIFHMIVATAGPGGTIVPGGITGVVAGGEQAYAFTADPGFHIKDLLVDGVSAPYMSPHE
jgi:hypothetical protein